MRAHLHTVAVARKCLCEHRQEFVAKRLSRDDMSADELQQLQKALEDAIRERTQAAEYGLQVFYVLTF